MQGEIKGFGLIERMNKLGLDGEHRTNVKLVKVVGVLTP